MSWVLLGAGSGLCACSLQDLDSLGVGGLQRPDAQVPVISTDSGVMLNAQGGASSDSGAGVGGTEMPGPVDVITSVFENGDFEGTGGGWVPVGNCTTTTSGDQAYSGQASLFTTQRTQAWEGPGYYLLDKATPGATYEVVVWVRTDEGAASLNLTYKHTCPGDGDGVYSQLVTRGVGTAWTELKGVLVVPSCQLFESVVYVEGALPGVSFYMDATSMLLAGS